MRILYKRPEDKYGKLIDVENSLEALQELIGGFLEAVSYGYNDVLICDEDGQAKGLKPNIYCDAGLILGPIIICGSDEEEFTDIDPLLVTSLRGYLLEF